MAWMGPAALAAALVMLALVWLTLPLPVAPPWPASLAVLALAVLQALRSQARGRPREAVWGGAAAILVVTAHLVEGAAVWTYRAFAALDASAYFSADPARWARFTANAVLVLAVVAGAVLWRVLEARAAGTPRIVPVVPEPARLLGLRRLAPLAGKLKKKLAPAKGNSGLPPVVLGRERETGEPVEISDPDRFLHTLVMGPTGCGKTSMVLAPMVFQDLEKLAAGAKLGVTVVEPKGDFTDAVAAYCEKLGLPYVYLNPPDEATHKFNPLEGRAYIVAESMRLVLTTMFGSQEAFFRQVQETAARQVILMLKAIKGDELTLLDVVRALRDPDTLSGYVTELERRGGDYDLIQFFTHELLGRLRDKYYQFASGLRQQLEDLTGNELLRRVLIGKSDVSLDRHLADGGVLLVNTAMGTLAKLGDTFGQLFILFFENAVFRRPERSEWRRTPHYLYVDELPRYLNHELERLLSLGRSYRCAAILAVQDPGQIEAVSEGFKKTVFTNCPNKVVFGGITEASARQLEREFGEQEVLVRSVTYDNDLLMPPILSKSWRDDIKREPRFTFTQIMDLGKDQFVCRVKRNGVYMPPVLGLADFHPAWKELTGPGAADRPEHGQKLTPITFRPGLPAPGNGSAPAETEPAPQGAPEPQAAPQEPPAQVPPPPAPAAPADDFWKF